MNQTVLKHGFITSGSSSITGSLAITSGQVTFTGAGNTSGTTSFSVKNSSATTTLAIRDDGNVGIGTTSPSYHLHVNSGTTNQVARFESSDNGALISIKDDDTTTYVGAENNLTYIGSTASASSNNLIINSSGYVGIGTTNPTTRLYLKGAGAGDGEIKIDSSANNTSFGIVRFQGDGSTYEKYLIGYNSAHGTQADELSLKNVGGDITLYTGPGGSEAERMRITSTGDVGIGTTGPSKKLHVNGGLTNFVALFESTDTKGGINLADNTTSTDGVSVYAIGNEFGIRTAGVDDRVRIDTSGNVGIGTTSIDERLHVQGSMKLEQSSGDINFRYTSNGTNKYNAFYQASTDSYGVYYNPASAYRFFISGSGDVGIGTNTPVGKFNSYISATRQLTHNGNGGDLSIISDNNTDPVFYVKGTGTADLVNVFDNTTNVFTIKDGGNVGIGTASPSRKLHIGGSGGTSGGIMLSPTSGDIEIQFQDSGTTNAYITLEDGTQQMRLRDDSADVLNVDFGTERVGIMTTSPTQVLDVAGAISVSGSVIDYDDQGGAIGGLTTVNIISLSPATTTAAFLDYMIVDAGTGTNQRSGTIQASINFTAGQAVINEVTTTDIGNTSAITFGITYGTPTNITATNSGGTPYDIKFMVRYF